MKRVKQTMDGNQAAAHASYAFTEVAAIFPITPSSPMAEISDSWSASGLKNIFGDRVNVVEMQSESGAAGAVHGSLAAGALTTTYTASQGLLLMIPNMYKIAGELLPCVINVSARSVATHALSIFGDHSDVYACRQTGFAALASSNPQEIMDLTPVAHLAALSGRVPFINFFDGFRTSHEQQKIEVWEYDTLASMINASDVEAFRRRALNPTRPAMRGSHQNGDVFFQNREACNRYYDAVPRVVETYLEMINERIGTDYKLFNYYGHPNAERVIVAMGSICDVAEEVVDYLVAQGERVGLIKVRLYRPFSVEHMLAVLPDSVTRIAVLDRTKEPGALGEPLYMDVLVALHEKRNVTVVGGRYGLSSKDTPPSSVFAVFENLASDTPKNQFTVGIVDDVTFLSLPECPNAPDTTPAGTISCKFWGLGGDGTVGANKNSIVIIGDHTDKYVQAYFQYDSKKTGGVTISHLRFGDQPIKSSYYVKKADFVACHNPAYIDRGFRMVQDVKPGGKFLINTQWAPEELSSRLSAEDKRYIAENGVVVYIVNATDQARALGMGRHTNTLLQSAFFALADIIPMEQALGYMKKAVYKTYHSKGSKVIEANNAAIDAGAQGIVRIDVPASWAQAADSISTGSASSISDLQRMTSGITYPINMGEGDRLPVSAFLPHDDGTYLLGASAYEKRGIAVEVPAWKPESCIQCNQCSFVCPHAAIRPYTLTAEEARVAPDRLEKAPMRGKGFEDYQFTLQVSPLDCMGCSACFNICPAPEKALEMKGLSSQLDLQVLFDYCADTITAKPDLHDTNSVRGSQFSQPLLEFSGACAGCAETAYAKLITQLFGERMYISNATGCSSIWGGPAAACPYTVNKASGHGPAWANSLFEDNAEHGFGMYLAQKTIRDRLIARVTEFEKNYPIPEFQEVAHRYLDTRNDGQANAEAAHALAEMCGKMDHASAQEIFIDRDYLSKKSVWIFGGDGWAYDIGFGGLDHVLASGEDINVFVFDTEVYSNTGGQASKASQLGQVAQFAAAGKGIGKKQLAEMALTYGYVYVAQVAMGADMNQTLKAIVEAESYPGPSLIIGYAPCEMHGIKGGMANCQLTMKHAVEAGYWFNFRFDPRMKERGENPFILDSKEPTRDYTAFVNNETRYNRLALSFPERADKLIKRAATESRARYKYLQLLRSFYDDL